MKSTLLFLLAAVTAAAAPAPSTPPITFQQEIGLYNALVAIDSGGLKNVDGKAAPFAFDFTSHARIAFARDMTVLSPVASALDKIRSQKILELAGGKPVDQNDPVFAAKLNMAMDAEYEKTDPNPPHLETVSEADLKLDTNPIPIKVQALLSPIITP